MPSSRSSLISVTLLICGSILGVIKVVHRQQNDYSPSSVLEVGDDSSPLQHRRLQEQGERPTMFTYYEQAKDYNPNDDAMDLIENWRKSWYDMGWNPVILTPQHAADLPQYRELMAMIPDGELIPEEAIRNYKRWMAMAAVGGGWMADINLFPLNYFLRHGRDLPYDGQLTTYMGPNAILVSGTGDEYLRMVHQIGGTAEKIIGHQKWLNENYPEAFKARVEWNDGIALKELRDKVSKDMFKVRGDVVEKGRIMKKDSQDIDCEVSNGKRAVYFRGLAPKPGESRGTIARKFLNSWRAACEVGQVAELPGAGKAKTQ